MISKGVCVDSSLTGYSNIVAADMCGKHFNAQFSVVWSQYLLSLFRVKIILSLNINLQIHADTMQNYVSPKVLVAPPSE